MPVEGPRSGHASDDGALLSFELPERAEAPAAARKALAALNGSLHLISEVRLRDAQLIASELVANALRHGGRPGGGSVRLTVRAAAGMMRVEVSDLGEGFDPASLQPPSLVQAGGWGLPIVAALAHRWGVERDPVTTVWFEIDRPQHGEKLAIDPAEPE